MGLGCCRCRRDCSARDRRCFDAAALTHRDEVRPGFGVRDGRKLGVRGARVAVQDIGRCGRGSALRVKGSM